MGVDEIRGGQAGRRPHALGREDQMSIRAEYKGLNDVGSSSRRSVWQGFVAYMKELIFFLRLWWTEEFCDEI